jgi:hypothetical protein
MSTWVCAHVCVVNTCVCVCACVCAALTEGEGVDGGVEGVVVVDAQAHERRPVRHQRRNGGVNALQPPNVNVNV